jgi:membrane peptidoglycan carboxypeptidase
LLDHTAAFGVFANMGTKHEVAGILKVSDSKGKVLEEWQADSGSEVIDPQIAYEIINIMTDNNARTFVFGPNSPLILPDRVVAAKTGTTQAWKDGWTMGYTPSLVAGVWTGNTNGSQMRAGADGVVTAGPIWHQFMLNALKDTPAETFPEPPGIQHIQVDSISGKLPTQYTPTTKEEVFASFAIPTDFDDVHVAKQINKLNGKLANSQTPPDLVENKVFTIIHSEQPDNPNWETPVALWARSAGYNFPTEQDDGSTDPNYSQSQIRFMTPAAGQEISSLPFLVQIDVGTNQVSSVDFSLDGIPSGTKTSSPFALVISSARDGTNQTLMATAHLTNGSVVSASIPININVKK